MATQNTPGVYQREDGYWEYRFTITVNGKKIPRRKSTDASGKKLKTKKDAIIAREEAMVALRQEKTEKPKIIRKTVKEVFEEFCQSGRKDRAYRTIQKQDSLWENHLRDRFGHRYVDEISVGEVNDYLAELYYDNELAFRYVESFLKMFYLIFGQAYSRNYLDVDIYNMLCVNKNTKIHMPKMKNEDDTEIISFSREQLATLDDYFRGTNAETAYLLGRYCGLRINECFGLKWENVDLENGTIYIDRQMQYQESLIKLVPPKTRNSKRTIQLCETMWNHLKKKAQRRAEDEKNLAIITLEVSRLSRSTQQLCEIIDTIRDKHLRLVIVGSITIDCRNGQTDPMSEAFLQMAGVFSQLELAMIRSRVRSGMENARAKGKQIGRKPTTKDDIPAMFYKHYPSYVAGNMNVSELARVCGLSRPTVYKYLKMVG